MGNAIDTDLDRLIPRFFTYDHAAEFFVRYADDLWDVTHEETESLYTVWSIFDCGFQCGISYGGRVFGNSP